MPTSVSSSTRVGLASGLGTAPSLSLREVSAIQAVTDFAAPRVRTRYANCAETHACQRASGVLIPECMAGGPVAPYAGWHILPITVRPCAHQTRPHAGGRD